MKGSEIDSVYLMLYQPSLVNHKCDIYIYMPGAHITAMPQKNGAPFTEVTCIPPKGPSFPSLTGPHWHLRRKATPPPSSSCTSSRPKTPMKISLNNLYMEGRVLGKMYILAIIYFFLKKVGKQSHPKISNIWFNQWFFQVQSMKIYGKIHKKWKSLRHENSPSKQFIQSFPRLYTLFLASTHRTPWRLLVLEHPQQGRWALTFSPPSPPQKKKHTN